MTAAHDWWRRPPNIPALSSIAELRFTALDALAQRPDLCRWQERATEEGRHVTAYCLLTDKLLDLELTLGDDRFDELDVSQMWGEDGRLLMYLYSTFALHAEQLLRELGRMNGTRVDKITNEINSYVNSMVKHRAEPQKNSIRPYEKDHHAPLSFADFEANPHPPGFAPHGKVWGVPSLVGFATHIRDRVTIFDQAVQDDTTRAAVEAAHSSTWT